MLEAVDHSGRRAVAHVQGATEFGQGRRSARVEAGHHRHLRTREPVLLRFVERVAEEIPPERSDVPQHLFRLVPQLGIVSLTHLTSLPAAIYYQSYTTRR